MQTSKTGIHLFCTSLNLLSAALLVMAGLLSNPEARAATLSWQGLGSTSGWAESANWGFAGVPASGDTVIFPGSQPRMANSNNIAGLTLNAVVLLNPAGGGYVISGNAFTVTNSIICTNTSGTNIINVPITLATADVLINVGSGATLRLGGNISGTVGVNKIGAGTLIYGGTANSYSGTTTMNAGLLWLSCGGFNAAFGGPLVIGDGTSSATVRLGLSFELPNTQPVTINNNGVLDLNNLSDDFGSLLTCNGNTTVQVGTATLTIAAPNTITSSNGTCNINGTGTLQLGAGPCLINVSSGTLNIYPAIRGAASITKTGQGFLEFYGNNAYTGLTVLSDGWLWARNNTALGTPAAGTVVSNGATLVIAGSIGITNESLTLNGPGEAGWAALDMEANETNVWNGPITLNTNSTIGLYNTSGWLRLLGAIDGTGGFQQIYGGTVVFEGTNINSYAGTTTVGMGTLLLNRFPDGGAIPGPLVVGANCTVRLLDNSQIWSPGKTVTLGNGSLFDLNGWSEWIGNLTMTGATINTGSGTLYLSGDLTVNSSTVAQSTINGKFNLWTGTRTFNNVGHNYSPDLRIYAVVTSGQAANGIIKNGPGEISLAGANPNLTGPITVNGGTLWAETSTSLGATNATATVNSGGGIFLDGALVIGPKPLVLNGAGWAFGALEANYGSSSWAGDITLATNTQVSVGGANTLTLSGAIGGPGALTKAGTGTLTFAGSRPNAYTGLTTVSEGTLVLNKSVANSSIQGALVIGDGSGGLNADVVRLVGTSQISTMTAITVSGSGLFDVNGVGEAVGSLAGSGNVTLGSGAIGIGYDNTSPLFSGVISGSGSVYKEAGSGTQTFSGNNTYTGSTFVYSGALVINGSQPQSPVSIGSGNILGGRGTVGTINASGSVAPGTSPGILNCSNVTFSASGNFRVELNGPTAGLDYDQLNVTGTVALGNASLSIVPGFVDPVGLGTQFVIIKNDGTDAVTGTFSGLAEGAIISIGGFRYSLSYVGGSGNDVVLAVIEVPAVQTDYAVTAGNGDHLIDPNECDSLTISISNKTGVAMSAIAASLSSADPSVIVTQPNSSYPNMTAFGNAVNGLPFQISVLPSFPCGNDIHLNLSLSTATHGAFTIPVVLQTGQPATVPNRYDVSAVTNIPDIGTIESTNVVAGFSGPITKIAVSLWLTHAYDADLSISLIAPDGTIVDLSSANGGGANFGTACAPDSSRTTFDDSAAVSITAGSPPFVGSYRPEGSLATAQGSPANGNWRLRITDSFGGSLGALRCWSLLLYPVACSDGGGACAQCGVTVTNILGAASRIQNGRLTRNGITNTCSSVKAWPGVNDTAQRHYELYPFYNGGSNACITITLTSGGCDDFFAVFRDTYDPITLTNNQPNYLADPGRSASAGGPTFCSLNVPANSIFLVVVNEIGTGLCGAPYRLTVSGGDCAPLLAINPAALGMADVSWPTVAGGYQLETSLTVSPTSWFPVVIEPVATANRFHATNSTTNPTGFFRVHKP